MANVKTAISIEEPLFEEVNELASEMAISRSFLFSLAVQEFIQRHRSQKLLDAINTAYSDFPDPNDEILQAQMRARHFELVKDQW